MKHYMLLCAVLLIALTCEYCSSPSDNRATYYPGTFPDTTLTAGVESNHTDIMLKTTRLYNKNLSVAVTCWSADSIEENYVMHPWTGYLCEIKEDCLMFDFNYVCGYGLTGGVSSKKTLTYILEPDKEMWLSKIVARGNLEHDLFIEKVIRW